MGPRNPEQPQQNNEGMSFDINRSLTNFQDNSKFFKTYGTLNPETMKALVDSETEIPKNASLGDLDLSSGGHSSTVDVMTLALYDNTKQQDPAANTIMLLAGEHQKMSVMKQYKSTLEAYTKRSENEINKCDYMLGKADLSLDERKAWEEYREKLVTAVINAETNYLQKMGTGDIELLFGKIGENVNDVRNAYAIQTVFSLIEQIVFSKRDDILNRLIDRIRELNDVEDNPEANIQKSAGALQKIKEILLMFKKDKSPGELEYLNNIIEPTIHAIATNPSYKEALIRKIFYASIYRKYLVASTKMQENINQDLKAQIQSLKAMGIDAFKGVSAETERLVGGNRVLNISSNAMTSVQGILMTGPEGIALAGQPTMNSSAELFGKMADGLETRVDARTNLTRHTHDAVKASALLLAFQKNQRDLEELMDKVHDNSSFLLLRLIINSNARSDMLLEMLKVAKRLESARNRNDNSQIDKIVSSTNSALRNALSLAKKNLTETVQEQEQILQDRETQQMKIVSPSNPTNPINERDTRPLPTVRRETTAAEKAAITKLLYPNNKKK